MTTVYKLTDPDMRTYGGYQWVLGKTCTFPGTGELCGPGWAHAYTHPLLAVLLNPLHAGLIRYRLFEALNQLVCPDCRGLAEDDRGDDCPRCAHSIPRGTVGAMLTDHGLKVGCSVLMLTKELPVPAVTTNHRVHFAILCALAVYSEPSFVTWAEKWLSGEDRSVMAAMVATWAARAMVAEKTAMVAAEAAWAATWAARAARAARVRTAVDLIQIAEAACADLLPLKYIL